MKIFNRPYRRHGKRVFDCLLAALLLILMSPVMAASAFLIALFMGRPILFSQQRPGFAGRPFLLHKFRTMKDLRDESGTLLPDSARLTRFGRFLRRTSLDELPELWNVLKGDLSLVGPRPLLMQYLERYTPEQARRHTVLPGITGWAQINGRNTLTWEEKFEYDVWYTENIGFGLDLKILMRTVLTVLRGRSTNAAGHASMPEFQGSTDE